MNLLDNIKVTRLTAATATGTNAVNSTSVDMQGFSGVVFVTDIGTAAANNLVNVATSSDDSAWNDLEGTSQQAAASGDLVAIDIVKPQERYLRLEVARGTSTTVGTIFALQYNGRKAPNTSIAAQETHLSPDEGTA